MSIVFVLIKGLLFSLARVKPIIYHSSCLISSPKDAKKSVSKDFLHEKGQQGCSPADLFENVQATLVA
jgi:hypothetical protein